MSPIPLSARKCYSICGNKICGEKSDDEVPEKTSQVSFEALIILLFHVSKDRNHFSSVLCNLMINEMEN